MKKKGTTNMKKLLVWMIISCMVFGSFSSAYGDEAVGNTNENITQDDSVIEEPTESQPEENKIQESEYYEEIEEADEKESLLQTEDILESSDADGKQETENGSAESDNTVEEESIPNEIVMYEAAESEGDAELKDDSMGTEYDVTEEAEQNSISANADSDIVASGMCGDAASWTLDSAGVLTISGEGSLYDLWTDGEHPLPWLDYIQDIDTAVVEPGITDLGAAAFYGCDKLVNVSLPEGLVNIGDHTFYACTSLKEIIMPDTVTTMEQCVFEYCQALEKVSLSSNLTYMDVFAFAYCNSLDNVALPSSLQHLGEWAFGECSSLKEIVIPEQIEELGNCAFTDCSNLVNISFQGPLKRLGEHTFSSCTSLKEIILPDTLESIGDYCFMESGLEHIEIPDNVKTIGDLSLARCSSLQTISIGKNLETSTGNPFSRCENLINITVSAENNYYSFVDGVLFSKDMKILYVYLQLKEGSEYNIPDSVTEIREEAFYGCLNLREITMSDSVESLGGAAFECCSNLKEVRLSESIKSLNAFQYCVNLESITLPAQLESVGYMAFLSCALLKSITLPESVKEIGQAAFDGCDSLEEITVLSKECEAKMENTTIPGNTIIKCYKGSLIENYANTFGRSIVYLDGGSGGTEVTGNAAYVSLLPVEGVTPSGHTSAMVRNMQDDVLFGYEPKIAIPDDLNNETYIEIWNKTVELTENCTTEYEKAVNITKFVNQYMEYRYAVPCDSNIGSVYDAWNKKYGNCMGHTALANFMFYLCGIPNATVNTLYHAYSLALIDGKWIAFDATGGDCDFDVTEGDSIEEIFFSIGKVSFVINDVTGVKLAGYGTSVATRDEEDIEEIDIPDYVTFVYGNIFPENTSPVTVVGNIESYAYDYVKTVFRFVREEDGRFAAFNYIDSEDLEKTEAKAATCTEDGNIEYWSCPSIGKYFSDQTCNEEIKENSWIIPALGHTPEIIPAKEATCEQSGLTEGSRCSVCGEILKAQEEIPALGHKPIHTAAVAATCETDGNIEYWTCERCGKIYKDSKGTEEITLEETVIQALGHSWDEGVVTKEATCIEAGEKTYTCKNDASHTKTEEIPALGHKLNHTAAVAATCETDGNIEYWTCERCGKIYKDSKGTEEISLEETVTQALGHSWDEGVVTKKATCTEAGEKTYTCKNDASHTKTEEIPATGHSFGKDGLCTECGAFKFTDIPSTSKKSIQYVSWAYEKDIVVGTGENTFSPDNSCTRVQFIMMLWKMNGSPEVTGVKNPFSDVSGKKTTKAVLWALKEGIITSGDKFNPDGNITRAQVVMILWKMTGSEMVEGTNPFTDVSGGKTINAVLWAYLNGITKGTSDTTFGPSDNCTRLQLVTFLYKYNKLYNLV